MKKYTKIAYITLILFVVLCGFFIYKVFAKNGKEDKEVKSKSLEEVKVLESKFLNLFNELNNITFENYQISVSEIKKENENSEQSSSKEGGSSSESKGEGGESEGEKSESSEGSSGGSDSEQSSESSSKDKSYNLEEQGILTQNSEINWKQIKNDVENLYALLYTITLDLYQTNVNGQDIMNFNKEYDNLTRAVKDEDKELTLDELAILYNYLPKFVENCTDSDKEITIIKTKDAILRAYSLLEKEQWATIADNINLATQEFTKLVTDISSDKEKTNQYNINKAYVMINEMQNAILLRDKDVFLIKYKNVLEELDNI